MANEAVTSPALPQAPRSQRPPSTPSSRPQGRQSIAVRRSLRFLPVRHHAHNVLRALMPLPVLLGVSYFVQRGGTLPEGVAMSRDRARSLVEALRFEGLVASPAEVHFVPVDPSRWDLLASGVRERAVVRAGRDRKR